MEFLVVGDGGWGFIVAAYVDCEGCSVGYDVWGDVDLVGDHVLFGKVEDAFTLFGKIIRYQLDHIETIHRHV